MTLCEQAELERLRLIPLNQVATIKLKQAGVAERDEVLPIFVLMEWGLSNGVPLVHHRTAEELLRLSLQTDQQSAMDFLVANIPGGVRDLLRRLLRLPPKAAAQILLDILDMRLKADPCNQYPLR